MRGHGQWRGHPSTFRPAGPVTQGLGDGHSKAGPEQDHEHIDPDQAEEQSQCRGGDQPLRLERVPPQAPERLDDDRDDDGLDTVQHPQRRRQGAEPDVRPGQRRDHQGRWEDEAEAGDQQAGPAGAVPADENGRLCRTRAGDEAGGSEKVEELRVGEPAAAADNLVLHQGDMGGRAAEGRDAQLEEQPRQFTQVFPLSGRRWGGEFDDSAVSHRRPPCP